MKYEKKHLQIIMCVMLFLLSIQTTAQNFYPNNFLKLFSLQKADDNWQGIVNKKYLEMKDLYPENDTLFVTKDKSELLFFNFILDDKKFIEIRIKYLLNPKTDLTLFLTKLGSKVDIEKNGDIFSQQSDTKKTQTASIKIQKNKPYLNKNYTSITFTLHLERFDKTGKEIIRKNDFPLSRAYPFQNSTWYFDSGFFIEKKANSYKQDAIITEISLSKQPKYPNKIIFTTDSDFELIIQENNSKGKFEGRYRTKNGNVVEYAGGQKVDVGFFIAKMMTPSQINKDGEPPVIRGIQEKRLNDYKKNSTDYLLKLFNLNYQLFDYNSSEDDLTLNNKTLFGGEEQPALFEMPHKTDSKK